MVKTPESEAWKLGDAIINEIHPAQHAKSK
jgi:hypothetical protein